MSPLRSMIVVLALGTGACASGGSSTGAPAQASQTVLRTSGGSSALTMTAPDNTNRQTVAAPPEQVFRLIPSVLDSLGIPVAMLEPAKRSIGNPGLKIRQRLKTTPLSRFIDCGTSTQVGANADSYDVSLSLIADVTAGAANSSTVTLTFDALAKPVNFSQGYSACNSRGALEARFFEILKGKLRR